jgi:uncharacterized protein
MELTCPKCHARMRTYERNGVHVDQCTECRGIFLDRGELERLVDAENDWHSPAGAAAPSGKRPEEPWSGPQGRVPGSPAQQLGAVVGEALQQARGQRHGGYGTPYGHPRKKKKSFLDELFG